MISPAPHRPHLSRNPVLRVRLPLALALVLPTASLWALEPPPGLPALAGPPVSASSPPAPPPPLAQNAQTTPSAAASAVVPAAPALPAAPAEASPLSVVPNTPAPGAAVALPPAVPVWIPPSNSTGPVRVTYWGIHAYDAHLYTRPDFDINQYEHHDLILQLSFARNFLSTDLARRAASKMADNARWGSETREQWRQLLAGLIPDIKRGDLLTIEHRADQGVQLRLNHKLLGSINDPAFARNYLGLWLSPGAADVALRRALLRAPKRTP